MSQRELCPLCSAALEPSGRCTSTDCPQAMAPSCAPPAARRKAPTVDSGAWFKCPACGIGQHLPEVLFDYHTKLGGRPVIVKEARVSKCNNCCETSVAALELERWEGLQREQELEARVATLESVLDALKTRYGWHYHIGDSAPLAKTPPGEMCE